MQEVPVLKDPPAAGAKPENQELSQHDDQRLWGDIELRTSAVSVTFSDSLNETECDSVCGASLLLPHLTGHQKSMSSFVKQT